MHRRQAAAHWSSSQRARAVIGQDHLQGSPVLRLMTCTRRYDERSQERREGHDRAWRREHTCGLRVDASCGQGSLPRGACSCSDEMIAEVGRRCRVQGSVGRTGVRRRERGPSEVAEGNRRSGIEPRALVAKPARRARPKGGSPAHRRYPSVVEDRAPFHDGYGLGQRTFGKACRRAREGALDGQSIARWKGAPVT